MPAFDLWGNPCKGNKYKHKLKLQLRVFYIFYMAMFDYISFADSLRINSDVVTSFEREAKEEFPNDAMLRELHIVRALKAYFNKNTYLAV
jgi:hypothetical protein